MKPLPRDVRARAEVRNQGKRLDIAIASALRQARRCARLTQAQLAGATGIGDRTISSLEVMQVSGDKNGDLSAYRTPSAAQLLRLLAACYGYTPEDLLRWLEERGIYERPNNG